jgi:uncharacterized protein YggE
MKKLALICFAIVFCHSVNAHDRIIAMTGEGRVKVTPDQITVSYRVSRRSADSATKAKSVVDQIASNSAEALVSSGVPQEKITSSSMRIHQSVNYDEDGNQTELYFHVSRSIDFVLNDISSYNQAIQALVDAGVTEVSSSTPTVSNFDEIEQRAVAAAAEDAEAKAKFLAAKLGASLGKVHQIGQQQVRRGVGPDEELVIRSRRKPRPPLGSIVYDFKPADIEISASVYVEFELN